MKTTPLCTVAALVAASVTSAASYAAETSLFVHSKEHILWRTAPGATFDVPVVMAPGATSATLTVAGHRYRRVYPGLAAGMHSVELPDAFSGDTENVYDFDLVFDDPCATAEHAKIGFVTSAADGGAAATDVRVEGARKWGIVKQYAVVRIPAGDGPLSVDGVQVDTGLSGAPGWYLLATEPGRTYEAAFGSDAATLYGADLGFAITFR